MTSSHPVYPSRAFVGLTIGCLGGAGLWGLLGFLLKKLEYGW